MQRSSTIHAAAISLVMGLALPLTADDSTGSTKDHKAKIQLVCGGRSSCGYGGYGSYGYSMPMMRAPQARAYPAAQPAYAPVAAAPAAPAPAPAQPNAVVSLSNVEDDTVAYQLEGSRYDMYPGYSQKLTNRPVWVVEFDRGGSFGTARYTLTQGAYKFVATERGWDLIKDTAASDAPAPPAPSSAYDNIARNR